MRQKICAIVPIVLLIIMTVPFAIADIVIINVDTNGESEVNVVSSGNFSVFYNGRDILGELEAAKKSINDMEKTFIYWAGQREAHDQDLLVVEEQLNNLTRDLNIVLGELYGNIGFTMHVVGINPGNSTISIQLIAGEMTIADYIDDLFVDVDEILVELNATDQEFASVQSEFENIYAGMMVQDTVLMGTRSGVRNLNNTFNAEIADLTECLIELDDSFDRKITVEIERKDVQIQQLDDQIEQLEDELYVLNREFETQRLVSYGGFGIAIVLLLGFYVLFGRKT